MKRPGKTIWRLFHALLFGLVLSPCAGGANGEELFVKNCASCHGKDGRAQTPIARKLGVKDLTQCKLSDAEIEKQIVDGRRDDHGKEKMPAFKGRFSDAEIKSLLSVVKGFRK